MTLDGMADHFPEALGLSPTAAWLNFIESIVLPTMPPDLPFAIQGWAGMAFDRTSYEDLAPDSVWECWMAVHNQAAGYPSGLGAVRYRNASDLLSGVHIKPDMESIRTYWDENYSFLRDHYVFSLDQQWIIRLDQDTTLFLGKLDVMRSVVDRLGGVAEVRRMMVDDFIGGSDDVVGLGDYIDGLLAPLS